MSKISNHREFPQLKRVKQETIFYCGPAVLQMLLGYLGVKVDQDEIVRAARVGRKIKKHGMTVGELAQAVQKLAPQTIFWYKQRATIMDLRRIINKFNYPAGIEWQGIFGKTQEDEGHYSIVTQVEAEIEKLAIADPYGKFAGRDRHISMERFKKRWWDTNFIKDAKGGKFKEVKDERMMFVVTPNNVRFPKYLKLRKV